jgi:hypothetical protein
MNNLQYIYYDPVEYISPTIFNYLKQINC